MHGKIILTKGTGAGATQIAAFDKALFDAGIANYNLIRLSSIIPPHRDIVREKYITPASDFGHKLYLVYASEIRHASQGEAWAGIGWVIAKDGTGKGLFTEHEGSSEQEVRELIRNTLTSMTEYREEEYSEIHYELVGTAPEDQLYSCAFVAAVYESEGWKE